jgi:hypothetical protein
MTVRMLMFACAMCVYIQELQGRLAAVEHTQMGNDGGKGFSLFSVNGGLPGGGGPLGDDVMDAMLRKGEREKELENMLLKTKRDKDKAIRIIVQIIGKDRIASFLNKHAGSPDILDKLLDYFATNVQLGTSGGSNSGGDVASLGHSKSGHGTPGSAQKSSRNHTLNPRSPSPDKTHRGGGKAAGGKSPAMYRSRMDEYFRSTISGRDF